MKLNLTLMFITLLMFSGCWFTQEKVKTISELLPKEEKEKPVVVTPVILLVNAALKLEKSPGLNKPLFVAEAVVMLKL